LRDHHSQWIATYQGRTSRGFRANTRARYREALEKRVLPWFGAMRLAEIEPQHIKQWLLHLAAQNVAPATIRNTFAPLRAMLADAADDGLIRHNPAAGVRIPNTAKHSEPKEKALTLEEVDRLRAALTGEDNLLLVDVLLVTGMRISELIGLNIGDVDYGNCRINISRPATSREWTSPRAASGFARSRSRPSWGNACGRCARSGHEQPTAHRCSPRGMECARTETTSTTACSSRRCAKLG
jgi:integrase